MKVIVYALAFADSIIGIDVDPANIAQENLTVLCDSMGQVLELTGENVAIPYLARAVEEFPKVAHSIPESQPFMRGQCAAILAQPKWTELATKLSSQSDLGSGGAAAADGIAGAREFAVEARPVLDTGGLLGLLTEQGAGAAADAAAAAACADGQALMADEKADKILRKLADAKSFVDIYLPLSAALDYLSETIKIDGEPQSAKFSKVHTAFIGLYEGNIEQLEEPRQRSLKKRFERYLEMRGIADRMQELIQAGNGGADAAAAEAACAGGTRKFD